jgi:chorismate-pyruvate lyase
VRRRALGLGLLLAAAACAQDVPAWPDTYLARVQALALVETLNAEVLASRSATATLEAWCREHELAREPKIVADRVRGAAKAATAEQRQRLGVTAEAEVKYRRVRLRCGERVLSEADNWYVPARLTAEMNRVLETTDAPFGKVVAALGPVRETFAVKVLWRPLPEGWERGAVGVVDGGAGLKIPKELFEHRAVLYTREHVAFSEVDEVYQGELLGFRVAR